MVRASHLTKNCKSASIRVHLFVATVGLDFSTSVDLEKILIRYRGNGLSRYDEEEYLESASRIRREKFIRGPQDLVGNVKLHPSVFLALSTVCVKILKLRSPSIFTSWVAVVLSSCFIHFFMASNILRVSLKRLTLPTLTLQIVANSMSNGWQLIDNRQPIKVNIYPLTVIG